MNLSRIHPLLAANRAGGLAALILLAACQQPETQNTANTVIEPSVPTLPPVVRPQPLDRTGLLAAVAQAASAEASGADDSTAQRSLDGRQFELRIRFGCRGPSTNLREEWLGWSFDRESRTLRVRAMPTLSAEEALVRELGGDEFEAVEGFWIPRPWLLTAACPAAAALTSATDQEAGENALANASANAAAASQPAREPIPEWPRIGIAQFFTETDPRTGRRSMRPYEAVKTLDADQPVGSQGFDLVLSGRLKALPDSGVILCAAKGSDSPPECIVSAEFDRVRIESPGSGDIVAEWGRG